ncbi:hypothetical protein CP8484711_0328A, partial [Chlamydia psittaci 84-8471/1]
MYSGGYFPLLISNRDPTIFLTILY